MNSVIKWMAALGLLISASAFADSPTATTTPPRLTSHESARLIHPTKARQLETMRDAVRDCRSLERGAKVNQKEFGKVLDDLQKRCLVKPAFTMAVGGYGVISGVKSTMDYGRAARGDIEVLLTPEGRNFGTVLRLGRDGTVLLQSSSAVVKDAASIAETLLKAGKWASRAKIVGKWAGPIGTGLMVATDGFEEGLAVWEYQHGTINRRQFLRTSASTGASTGAIALGAAIGTIIEPGGGTLIGAGIGALFSWPASRAATYAVDSHYGSIDARQKAQFEEFIFHYYGVN